jgi:hypothetical protein
VRGRVDGDCLRHGGGCGEGLALCGEVVLTCLGDVYVCV